MAFLHFGKVSRLFFLSVKARDPDNGTRPHKDASIATPSLTDRRADSCCHVKKFFIMERTIKLPASPSERTGILKFLPDFDKIATMAADLGAEELTVTKISRP